MPTDKPQLLVNVVAGESPIGFMRFMPGEQVAPLTVGLDAHWPIRAEGVSRVHLSLRFNGEQLFVATAGPEIRAYINGAAIDGRWWRVEAPAELRFGQACLRIAFDGPSARPPVGQSARPPMVGGGGAKTALDGGGQWDIHHRSDAPPAGQRTQMYDPKAIPGVPRAPVVREAPPPAIVPAPMVSPPAAATAPVSPPAIEPTRVVTPPPVAPPQAPVMPAIPILAPPLDAGEDQPLASTMRRPIGYATPAVPPPAVIPQPIGQPLGYAGPPAGYAMPPGAAGYAMPPAHAPSASPPRAFPSTHPSFDPRNPSGPPAMGPQGPFEEDPIPPPPGTSGGLLAAWRSISLVKKVTALLLPLAIVAVLLPEPDPPPNAPATVRALPSAPLSAGSTSAAPVAQAAPPSASSGRASSTASATALAATPSAAGTAVAAVAKAVAPPVVPTSSAAAAAPGAPPSPAPASPADDTLAPRATNPVERAAIDAAFAGRWQDAAHLYDRLAAVHPDEPVFRDAARILRETKFQPK